MHLITREAVMLFLEKLAPDGVLAYHISNRHLDLEPVLTNLARDPKLGEGPTLDVKHGGLAAIVGSDREAKEPGKTTSTWVLLSRDRANFGKLADAKNWEPLRERAGVGTWTDDFSNILSVFDWER
jgi:hypothetical protein